MVARLISARLLVTPLPGRLPFRVTFHLFSEVQVGDHMYLLAVSWSRSKLSFLVLEHVILKALITLQGERPGGKDQLVLKPVWMPNKCLLPRFQEGHLEPWGVSFPL